MNCFINTHFLELWRPHCIPHYFSVLTWTILGLRSWGEVCGLIVGWKVESGFIIINITKFGKSFHDTQVSSLKLMSSGFLQKVYLFFKPRYLRTNFLNAFYSFSPNRFHIFCCINFFCINLCSSLNFLFYMFVLPEIYIVQGDFWGARGGYWGSLITRSARSAWTPRAQQWCWQIKTTGGKQGSGTMEQVCPFTESTDTTKIYYFQMIFISFVPGESTWRNCGNTKEIKISCLRM